MKDDHRCKLINIFKPKKLAGFTVKNSVKYAACSVSNFNTRDGLVTERELARMKVIVATGAGLITNQGAYPDPKGEGKGYYRQLCIAEDKYLPGLTKVAEMIHANGCVAIQQILHCGRYGGIDLNYCLQPSDVPQTLRHFRPPKVMSKQDIKQAIEYHVDAARRALKAGFDGIEITSFMGYLLSNFLSKFTNKRTDEYGGDLKKRSLFMCELIGALKETIGSERPLIIRLNGAELMDEYDGNTEEECLEVMKIAEAAGVDCISLVVGWHESRQGALGRDIPHGGWLYLAEKAKKALKVPIAFGPRFGSPILADQALAEGKIDFWEVCRPFLADPDILHKVKEDRMTEIRPCTGELMCLARMFRNLPYICTVNPRLGHEFESSYDITPAKSSKKVVVIGGGPSGMECALIAAKRGHRVSIYEMRKQLGGQLLAAAKEVESGKIYLDLISYYQTVLDKHGVEIHLGESMDADKLALLQTDVAVLATGVEIKLAQDGNGLHVPVFNLFEVLIDEIEVGQKVAVISSERAGLVTAEYLASKGKEVVILESTNKIGKDVIPTFKWRHIAWLKEYKIATITSAKLKTFTPKGLCYIDKDGNEKDLLVDSIVIAGPRSSRQEFVESMEFATDEMYVIGDAVMPRSLSNAIHEGFKIGVRI